MEVQNAECLWKDEHISPTVVHPHYTVFLIGGRLDLVTSCYHEEEHI